MEQLDRRADGPEEENQRRRTAAVSEIEELQGAFEVPDADWSKLSALADSLGTGSPDQRYDLLGRFATYRQIMMSSVRPPAEKDTLGLKRRAAKIAELSEALLSELNSVTSEEALSSFLNSADDRSGWLKELRSRAKVASTPTKPLPHNVDLRREIVWRRLIEIFEASTGRAARVSIGATGTKHAGNGYGKIVDFIQAFAAVVPGSPIPTAHQIRAFEKKCRDKRRMASELPKDV
jgi:hypothetical protein